MVNILGYEIKCAYNHHKFLDFDFIKLNKYFDSIYYCQNILLC